jgi:hypothetical protein
MTTPTQNPGYWTPNTAPRLGTGPASGPTNVFAWIGLIISVSGFIFNVGINGLVGIAFSIVGLRDARRIVAGGATGDGGRALAIAGIITGIVHLIATAAIVVGSILLWAWFTQWIEELPGQIISQTVPTIPQ